MCVYYKAKPIYSILELHYDHEIRSFLLICQILLVTLSSTLSAALVTHGMFWVGPQLQDWLRWNQEVQNQNV